MTEPLRRFSWAQVWNNGLFVHSSICNNHQEVNLQYKKITKNIHNFKLGEFTKIILHLLQGNEVLRHVALSLNSRGKCSPAEEAIKILFVRISLWSQAESVIVRNNHSYMICCAFLHGHNHLVFNMYHWFIISCTAILL